jgi:hypothetical protein
MLERYHEGKLIILVMCSMASPKIVTIISNYS